jgi:uncharacterized membrane protein HdeD (DUF308 family)
MIMHYSKNWWVLLVNGIIALVLGLFAIFSPEGLLVTLAKYFGFLIIIAGIILGISGFRKSQKQQPSFWLIVEAVIIIILGAIILLYTEETLAIFAIIMGIWAIAVAILQFILLSNVKDPTTNKNLILINAIITLAFGIILFFNPFTGLKIFTILIGLVALVMGVLMIMIAFNVKKALDEE